MKTIKQKIQSSQINYDKIKEGLEELHKSQDFHFFKDCIDEWHPAILGAMLKAIANAKAIRYPLSHRDYDEGVQYVLSKTLQETPNMGLEQYDEIRKKNKKKKS